MTTLTEEVVEALTSFYDYTGEAQYRSLAARMSGCVVVPVEPTEGMLFAHGQEVWRVTGSTGNTQLLTKEDSARCYRAMLAASEVK